MAAFGDSSGKGAAAALYGAVLAGLLRTLAPRWRNPAHLMKALNDKLVERPVEARYVTLLLMLWSPQTLRFTLANAGNTVPMICRGGEILKLHLEGVPLGLLPDRDYDETVFQAQPGDTIVLYSDGVSDHQSPANEEYGRDASGESGPQALRKLPAGSDQRHLRRSGPLQHRPLRRSDCDRDASQKPARPKGMLNV